MFYSYKNKELDRAAIYNAVYIDRNEKLSDEVRALSVENAFLKSQLEMALAKIDAQAKRLNFREWQGAKA